MALQLQPTVEEMELNEELQERAFSSRGCSCFCINFPCFGRRRSGAEWERISTSDKEQEIIKPGNWWENGINAFKKVREWSELVAGPKWKTFIRRFNKTRPSKSSAGKFQYDPLSYALNFDDGSAKSGQLEEDRIFRDFSSRYAAIPASMDLGNNKESPLFT